MSDIKKSLPLTRAVAAPGMVMFGLTNSTWQTDKEDIGLSYEMTPERAREIAAELIETALNAARIGRKFPELAPVNETAAIEAEVQF